MAAQAKSRERALIGIKEVLDADPTKILWDLMAEVEPYQAISHKAMPTWEEHAKFVGGLPHAAWFLIRAHGEYVGMIYLTANDKFGKKRLPKCIGNEIGIRIFKRHIGEGHGTWAVQELMRLYRHQYPFYANIAPGNEASKAFFRNLNFRPLQETFICEAPPSLPK